MIGRPKQFWQHHNLSFLLSLGLGMGFGVVIFAQVIRYSLANFPPVIWAFFFGVISASIMHMARQRSTSALLYYALPGVVLGIGFVALPVGDFSGSLAMILIAGALAICAWILPGISGSFVLLLLGLYDDIILAVTDRDLQVLATLACGCGLGILLFARSLAWVLDRYADQLLAFLIGFMSSALLKLWPWQDANAESVFSAAVSPTTYTCIAGLSAYTEYAVLAGLLGVLALWLMTKYSND
jgi:putative membrane protein